MEDLNLDFEPEGEEVKAKKGKFKRMRNLSQYKDLSDEDFDKAISQKALGISLVDEFEKQIAKKLAEFEQDYDLSDLKINDRDSLRALIQAHLTLESYEQELFKLRSVSLTDDVMYRTEKLSKVMSDLRSDIAKIQNELNISRKVRKSDQDVSVLAYIDNLKARAKKFYEQKMGYIFCPKCNELLATIWVLYGDEERNKVQLICNRTIDRREENGKTITEICGEKVTVLTKDLIKSRGVNKKEIFPESML